MNLMANILETILGFTIHPAKEPKPRPYYQSKSIASQPNLAKPRSQCLGSSLKVSVTHTLNYPENNSPCDFPTLM